MPKQHTVTSYDDDLVNLTNLLVRMGGLVENQLDCAIRAMMERDTELAERVIRDDLKADAIEDEVGDMAVKLLALRQPMATDLRYIVGAIRISSDLERIGDYAKNIAKRSVTLSDAPSVQALNTTARMGRPVQKMVKDVLDSLIQRSGPKAIRVWENDDDVDDFYDGVFRELLTYMMEDPRNITSCMHLAFVAKNLERIGDHATNIAEAVFFIETGRHLEEEYANLGPEAGAHGDASRAQPGINNGENKAP